MLKLTIDNKHIEVPPGTRVIDAAEQAGIMIPRFCYHPALGSVGACRVCAVKVLKGSCQGIRMSCMIDAEEGMVISTTDGEAVAFRRQVIEWLMTNHPHDCPVCDEGGQCLLQDMTVSGGHGRRRFPGKKRTHVDQYLGPLVQHEMNRCIQCYRCVRFYREYAGYDDLGVMGSAGRVYFGRRSEGVLGSPFAGNLIDVCPTGVFTDKPSRFKGRHWDFERTPGVCIHCSLGCSITVSTRYRQVVRVEAAFNPQVNGYFVCDRGRYGFEYASSSDRPRSARIDGHHTDVKKALETAANRLATIEERYGVESVALAASPRISLDTLGAAIRFSRKKGWRGPFLWPGSRTAAAVRSAAANLEVNLSISLKDIEKSDFILLAGADPVHEAPMLALALRQAWRNGAAVPSQLTAGLMRFAGRAVTEKISAGLGTAAQAFLKACLRVDIDPTMNEHLDALAETARGSRRPTVVCGTGTVSPETPAAAADTARLLTMAGKDSGLFFVLPGANALAAGLTTRVEDHYAALRVAIENGRIRALVAMETDLAELGISAGDGITKNLDLLITCDYLDTAAARAADIFIPTQTVFEAGGIFVNQEARVQASPPVFKGGTPIVQVSGGDHPPRTFEPDIPGSDPRPAWQVLAALARKPIGVQADALRQTLAQPLAEAAAGARLALPSLSPAAFSPLADDSPPGDNQLEVIVTEQLFGSEPLSRRSACLQELETPPRLGLHPGDAAALNIADGQQVAIDCGRRVIEGEIALIAEMARGVVLVPQHRALNWQPAVDGPLRIALTDIRATHKKGTV